MKREELRGSNLADSVDLAIEERGEHLPVLGRPQLNENSFENERDYLLSLQSFRFCLRSLPLIKHLSSTLIEQKTTISSHTANDVSSSSQHSILGHWIPQGHQLLLVDWKVDCISYGLLCVFRGRARPSFTCFLRAFPSLHHISLTILNLSQNQ